MLSGPVMVIFKIRNHLRVRFLLSSNLLSDLLLSSIFCPVSSSSSSLVFHLLSCLLFFILSLLVYSFLSSLSFSSSVLFSRLLFSFLVLSCLVSLSLFLSVSLCSCLSVSVSVWWCVVWFVCCVLCVLVWLLLLLLLCVVCCVWCGTQKKPPCVDSKRPRVYRHHAHMCQNMRAWCRYTQGRFESTHGGFLDGHTGRREGGHRQFCLPKFAHRGLSRAHLKFENRSNTARSRFLQSFALPESCSVSAVLRDTAEGTTNTPPTHHHHHHHHSLPPLPSTHTTHLHDH